MEFINQLEITSPEVEVVVVSWDWNNKELDDFMETEISNDLATFPNKNFMWLDKVKELNKIVMVLFQ